MKPCATAVIAARPTAGASRLTLSEPSSEKNAATREGSRLHHAAVYFSAKLRKLDKSPAESLIPAYPFILNLFLLREADSL
jgi:hypothetical protein